MFLKKKERVPYFSFFLLTFSHRSSNLLWLPNLGRELTNFKPCLNLVDPNIFTRSSPSSQPHFTALIQHKAFAKHSCQHSALEGSLIHSSAHAHPSIISLVVNTINKSNWLCLPKGLTGGRIDRSSCGVQGLLMAYGVTLAKTHVDSGQKTTLCTQSAHHQITRSLLFQAHFTLHELHSQKKKRHQWQHKYIMQGSMTTA